MEDKDNLAQPAMADLFSTAAVRAEQGWKKLPFRVAVTSGPVSGQTETTTDMTARSQAGQRLNPDKELPSLMSISLTRGAGSRSTAAALPGMLDLERKAEQNTLKKTEEELLQQQVFAARMMGVPVTVAGNIVGTLRSSNVASSSGITTTTSTFSSSRPSSSSPLKNVTKQTSIPPAKEAQAHLIATAFYNTVKPLLPASVTETMEAAAQIQKLQEQQQQLLAQLNRQPSLQQQRHLTLQAPQQVPDLTATLNVPGKVQPQKWSNRAQTITANKIANTDLRQLLVPSQRTASAVPNISNTPEKQALILKAHQTINSALKLTGLQDPRRNRLGPVSYPVRSTQVSSTMGGILEPHKLELALLEKAKAPVSVELQRTQSLEVLQSLKADGYIDSPSRDKLAKISKDEPKTDDVDDVSTIWPSTLDEEDWKHPEPVPEPPNYKSRGGTSSSKSSPISVKRQGSKPSKLSSVESSKREANAKVLTPKASDPAQVISPSLFSAAPTTEIPFLSEIDTDATISSIDKRVEMLKKQKEKILQDQLEEFCKEIREFEDGAGDSNSAAKQKKATHDQKGVSPDKDKKRAKSKEQDKLRQDDRHSDKDRYNDRGKSRDRRTDTRSPPRSRPADAKRSRSQSHHREVERKRSDYKSPPSPKRSRSGSLEKTKKDHARERELSKEMEKRQGRYPSSGRQVSRERRPSLSPERKRRRPEVKTGEVFIDGRWQLSALTTPPPAATRHDDLLTRIEEARKMDARLEKVRHEKKVASTSMSSQSSGRFLKAGDQPSDEAPKSPWHASVDAFLKSTMRGTNVEMKTSKIDMLLEIADQAKKDTLAKSAEQTRKNVSTRTSEPDSVLSTEKDNKAPMKNLTSTTAAEKDNEKTTEIKATEKFAKTNDMSGAAIETKEKLGAKPSETEEQKNATCSIAGKEEGEISNTNKESSSDTKTVPGWTSAKTQRQTRATKPGTRTMQDIIIIDLTDDSAVLESSKTTVVNSGVSSLDGQASSSGAAASGKKSASSTGDAALPSSQLSVPASSPSAANLIINPFAAEGSTQSTPPSAVTTPSKSPVAASKTVGGGPTVREVRKRKASELTEAEAVPCKIPVLSGDSSSAPDIKESSISHQMGLLKALGAENYVQDKVMLEWFCYVCGSICHAFKIYKSHIGGRKHRVRYNSLLKANPATMEKELISKLKLLPKQGSDVTLGKNLLGQSSGLAAKQKPDTSPQAVRSIGSYCKICFCNYSCSLEDHVSSTEHKKFEQIRPRCVPCNLIFQKIAAYHKHINTLAHKKNVGAQEKRAAPVASHVTNKPAEDDVSEAVAETIRSEQKPNVIGSEFITPISGFFCKLCSKFYNNENTAREVHCATPLHISKTQQYYASRNQSSGTSFKASQGTMPNETSTSATAEQAALADSITTESISQDANSAVIKRSAGNCSSNASHPRSAQRKSAVGQMFAGGASLRSNGPNKAEMPLSVPDSKTGEDTSKASVGADSYMKTFTTEAGREPEVVLPLRKIEKKARKRRKSKRKRGATLKEVKMEADKPAEIVTFQKVVSEMAEMNPEETEGRTLPQGESTATDSTSKEFAPLPEASTYQKTVPKVAEMHPEKPGVTKPKEVKSDGGKPGVDISQKELSRKRVMPVKASLGSKSAATISSPNDAAVQKSPIEDRITTEASSLEINLQQEDSSDTSALEESTTSQPVLPLPIKDPSQKIAPDVSLKTKAEESEITVCHPKVSSLKEAPRRTSTRRTRSTKASADNVPKESPVTPPVKTRSPSGSKTEAQLKESTTDVVGQEKPLEAAISSALSKRSPLPEKALPEETLASNVTPDKKALNETTSKIQIPPTVVTAENAPASNSRTEVPLPEEKETTARATFKGCLQRISTRETKPAEKKALNPSTQKTSPESTSNEDPLKQATVKEVMPKEVMPKTISPKKKVSKSAHQKDVASLHKESSVPSPKPISVTAPASSSSVLTLTPSHLEDANAQATVPEVVVPSPGRNSTCVTNVQSNTVIPVTEPHPKEIMQKKSSKEAHPKKKASMASSNTASKSAKTNVGDKTSAELKDVQPTPTTSIVNLPVQKISIKKEVTDSDEDGSSKAATRQGKLPKTPRSQAATSGSKLRPVTSTAKKQPVTVTAASTLPAKQGSSKPASSKVRDSERDSSLQNESLGGQTTETAKLASSLAPTEASDSKSQSSQNASLLGTSDRPDVLLDTSATEEQGEYMDFSDLMASDVIILDEDSDQEMDAANGHEDDVVVDAVGEDSDISGDVLGEDGELGEDWIVKDVEGSMEEEEGHKQNPEDDVEDVKAHSEDVEGHSEDVEGHSEDVEGHSEDVEGHVEGHLEDFEGNFEDAEGHLEDVGGNSDVEGHSDVKGHLEDVEGHSEDVEGHVEGHLEDFEGIFEDAEGHLEDVGGNSDVEGHFEDVEVHFEDVEGYFEDVEGQLGNVEGYLEDVKGFVEDIVGSVEDTEGFVDDVEGSAKETKDHMENAEGIVEDIVGSVEDTEGDVEDVEGSAEETKGHMEDAEDIVEDIVGSVEDTEGDVEDVEGSAEETKGHMEDAEDIVEDIVGSVEDTEGDVEDVEGSAEETKGHMEDAEDIVEDIVGSVEDTEGDVEDIEGSAEETKGHMEDVEDIVEDIVGSVEDTEGHMEDAEDIVEDIVGYVEDTQGNVEDAEGIVKDTEGGAEGIVEDILGSVEDSEGDVEDVEGYLEDIVGSVEDSEGEVEYVEGYVEDIVGSVEDMEGLVDDVDGYFEDVEGYLEDEEDYVEDIVGDVEDVEGYIEDIGGDVKEAEGSEEDAMGEEEDRAGFEMPDFGEMFSIDEVGDSDEEMEPEGVGHQDVHQVEEWEVLSEAED